MKRFLFTGFACGLLAQDASSQQIGWGEGPVAVGLVFSNSTGPINREILATVFIRNDSDREIRIPVRPENWVAQFVVSDEQRRLLPQKPVERVISGVATIPLPPGSVSSSTIDLRQLVEMQPGDLVVTAKRFFNGKQFALSANVPLRVLPPNSSTSELSVETSAIPAERQSSSTSPQAIRQQIGLANTQPTSPSSSVIPKSAVERPSDPITGVGMERSSTARKLGIGLIVGLVLLLVTIVWRASRRKPQV